MVAESLDGDNPKAIAVVKEDVWKTAGQHPHDTNKFPATVAPATQDESAWDALVERMDALEKAAKDIAKMEKATKKAPETQQVEQSVEDTRTLISVNFDKLFEESEKIKAKSKGMEEWCVLFNSEQKKRFKDQEKKISKKIDSKLYEFGATMSANIDATLEANQEKNSKNFEHLTEKINRLVSALTTLQHSHPIHDNAL
eukprot:9637865-Ditylum_brightwellii.AAC.1